MWSSSAVACPCPVLCQGHWHWQSLLHVWLVPVQTAGRCGSEWTHFSHCTWSSTLPPGFRSVCLKGTVTFCVPTSTSSPEPVQRLVQQEEGTGGPQGLRPGSSSSHLPPGLFLFCFAVLQPGRPGCWAGLHHRPSLGLPVFSGLLEAGPLSFCPEHEK
jgi:hypothetical protein